MTAGIHVASQCAKHSGERDTGRAQREAEKEQRNKNDAEEEE
jgi:hypothetical protein